MQNQDEPITFKGIKLVNPPGENLFYINATVNAFLKCKSIMYLVQSNLNCYSPQTMYFRLLGRQVFGRPLLGRPLLGHLLLGHLLLGHLLLGHLLSGRPLLGRRSSSWETRPKGGYSQLVYIYIYILEICSLHSQIYKKATAPGF